MKMKVLAVLGTLLLLAILGVTTYRLQGTRMLRNRLHAIEARGEPVHLDALAATHALPAGPSWGNVVWGSPPSSGHSSCRRAARCRVCTPGAR